MALLQSAMSVILSTSWPSDSTSFASLCSPPKDSLSLVCRQQVSCFPVCGSKKLLIFAVTSPAIVRKPMLPDTGVLSNLSERVSQRVVCTDVISGKKLELKYAKAPTQDFCEFTLTTPKQEVIAFIRDILTEAEGVRKLQDFHMKVRDIDSCLRVQVFFNDYRKGPELAPYMDCIGCSMDTNLFVGQEPGMASKECVLEELSLRPYAFCRLDPKGRSGCSIMPIRHVERMSDLNDEELYAVWSIAARLLQQLRIPFISLIMNHGSYRTFHHLNLKLWVDGKAHEKLMSALNPETKELWYRLQTFAVNRPKKPKACFFFKKHGGCRNGEYCSYSHCT